MNFTRISSDLDPLHPTPLILDTEYSGYTTFHSARFLRVKYGLFTLRRNTGLAKACAVVVGVECKMDDAIELGISILQIWSQIGIYRCEKNTSSRKMLSIKKWDID
jgi:hypothetical protein